MRRRSACSAVVFLAASPLTAAQVAERKARIGFLTEAPLDQVWQRAAVEPFRRGLRELGYREGQNMVLEIRSAEGKSERLKPLMPVMFPPGRAIVSASPARTGLSTPAATTGNVRVAFLAVSAAP